MITDEVRTYALLTKRVGLSRLRAERALLRRFPTLEKRDAAEALGDLGTPGLWSEAGLSIESKAHEYDAGREVWR